MNREEKFFRWSVIAMVVAIAFWLVPGWLDQATRVQKQKQKEAQKQAVIKETPEPTPITGIVVDGDEAGMEVDMSDALLIMDIKDGEGPEAKAGDHISAHYVGTLSDGTVFDSSRDRGVPFDFTLGAGQVIQGWDEGIVGMKVGGIRKLTIPPEMGYGDRAVGSIPANSTLTRLLT